MAGQMALFPDDESNGKEAIEPGPICKQDGVGKRTYTGFNAPWKASQGAEEAEGHGTEAPS